VRAARQERDRKVVQTTVRIDARPWRSAILALALAVLAGCAAQQPRESPSEGGAEPPSAETEQARPGQAGAPSAAIVALAERADAQARSGEFEAAAANLERALRIEPDSAPLWTRLANVRLEQGEYLQAEDLALRSNSLAPNDLFLQSVNWRLIADARRQRGDSIGAGEADKRAQALEARAR
jgi:tetratricopeptide (TPR) repeat protein